jgi:polyisoprenoid-binding protein YceI
MATRYVHSLSVFFALAIGLGSGPGFVAAQTGQKATPQSAAWEVDVNSSRIYVKVGLATRLGHAHGVEGRLKSGKLTLGGGGELIFDMASFTADTPAARKRVGLEKKKVSQNEAKKVTAAMRSATVLDVAKYPTATCRLGSITPLDKQKAPEAGTYRLEGRFTLHGTEKKLQFKAKLEPPGKEGVSKLTGSFTIRLTDYGIQPPSAAGGLAKSADELTIMGDLVLKPVKGN